MREKNKFSKNFASIFIGQILSLFLNIIIFALVARYLGVENFGEFSYWLAIVGILSKLIDFGFNPIVFREYSKSKNIDIFSSVFTIRIFLIIILFISTQIYFYFNNSSIDGYLIGLMILNIAFSHKYTFMRDLLYIPSKVDYEMNKIYVIVILENMVFLTLVVLMPYFNGGITYFIFIYLFVNLPGTFYIIYRLIKSRKLNFTVNFSQIKYLFKESLPLYGFVLLSVIYIQIELLLLDYFHGKIEVGLYSAAVRLTRPLELIPSIMVTAFFPLIVKNISSKKKIADINSFNVRFLSFVSLAFVSVVFFKSEELINLIFGNDYIEASTPLVILSFTLLFSFICFYILDLLTALGKQKINFIYITLILSVSVIASLILIPQYSIVGASLSKVISIFIGFLFLIFSLRKYQKIKSFFNVKLLVFFLVVFTLLYLISSLNIYLYIIFSWIIVVIALIISRLFSKEEYKFFFSAVLGKMKSNES